MSPASDWFGWDAWKSGDPDESKRALDAETDRSLARNPERQPWGKTVDDTVEQPSTVSPYRGGHGHHGRPGRGGQTERHTWSDREWRNARDDYLLKNEPYLRDERERAEAEDARERAERAWRDELFQTRDHDDRGGGRGLFW